MRRSRTASHASSAGHRLDQDHVGVGGVERAQVRVEVVRVRGGVGGRLRSRRRRNRPGRATRAREHGDVLVALVELRDLGAQRVRRDERRRRLRRVVRRRACPTRAAPPRPARAVRRPSTRASSRCADARRDAAARARRRRSATIVDSMPTSQAPPSRISRHGLAEIVGDVRARSSARCGRSDWPTAPRCRRRTRRGARARPDATARAGRRCPGRR